MGRRFLLRPWKNPLYGTKQLQSLAIRLGTRLCPHRHVVSWSFTQSLHTLHCIWSKRAGPHLRLTCLASQEAGSRDRCNGVHRPSRRGNAAGPWCAHLTAWPRHMVTKLRHTLREPHQGGTAAKIGTMETATKPLPGRRHMVGTLL